MQLGGCSSALTSALAFVCVLLVLGVLLGIPFGIARLRGVNATLDRFIDKVAALTGAATPPRAHSAQRPAPKQFLRSLQVTPYAAPSAADLEAGSGGEGPEECCICFAEYEPGVPTIKLECSHFFHKRCILAWLHVDAVCPICKAQLVPDEAAKHEQQQQQQPPPPSECDSPRAQAGAPATAATARDTPAAGAAAAPAAGAAEVPAPAPAAPPAAAEVQVALTPLRPHAAGAAAAGVAGASL